MEHGPIWIVTDPAPPYSDGRFDGMATVPPLNPNQPTPEQIADAARMTVKEIETVFSNWMFPTISALPHLRALHALLALLAPPAPQWQAKEE